MAIVELVTASWRDQLNAHIVVGGFCIGHKGFSCWVRKKGWTHVVQRSDGVTWLDGQHVGYASLDVAFCVEAFERLTGLLNADEDLYVQIDPGQLPTREEGDLPLVPFSTTSSVEISVPRCRSP